MRKINSNLDVNILNINGLSNVTGVIILYKKCGIIIAKISLTLGTDLIKYASLNIGKIPNAKFFPATGVISSAVWTDKYLQPMHVGYVNVDNLGNIIIRTSNEASTGFRINANLSWMNS